MGINEKIVLNILEELVKLSENEEFKKNCPDITPQEYLCVKVHKYIKPQRLVNILNLNIKSFLIHYFKLRFVELKKSSGSLVKENYNVIVLLKD